MTVKQQKEKPNKKPKTKKVNLDIPDAGIFLPRKKDNHTCSLFVNRVLDQALYITLSEDCPRHLPVGEVFGGGITIKAVQLNKNPNGGHPIVRFGLAAPKYLAIQKEEFFFESYETGAEYILNQIDWQKKLDNAKDRFEYWSNVKTALNNVKTKMVKETRKFHDMGATSKKHSRYVEYLTLKEQLDEVINQHQQANDLRQFAYNDLQEQNNNDDLKFARNLVASCREHLTEDQCAEIFKAAKEKGKEED